MLQTQQTSNLSEISVQRDSWKNSFHNSNNNIKKKTFFCFCDKKIFVTILLRY